MCLCRQTITRPRLEGNKCDTTVNEAVKYAALPMPSTVLRALENTMNSSAVGMSITNLQNEVIVLVRFMGSAVV